MNLSSTQTKALEKLTDRWQSAYELQCSLATLNSLVAKGLADKRSGLGSMAFPRNSIEYKRR